MDKRRIGVAMSMLISAMLMGCQSTLSSDKYGKDFSDNELVPCWVQTPVSSEREGFIGVTPAWNADGQYAIKASRKIALIKLAQFKSIELTDADFEQLSNRDIASISLQSGHVVTFLPPFIKHAVMYSYAFLTEDDPTSTELKALQSGCFVQQCNFAQCAPKWLCQTDPNTITSVSYFTASSHEQLAESERNARIIASLLNGSHVRVVDTQTEVYRTTLGEAYHSTQRSRIGKVTGRNWQAPLIHTQSCFYGNTLVAQFLLPALNQLPISLPKDWKTAPQYQGRAIALGNFGEQGAMSADTLLSTAIDHAIKDALVELAKVKGVEIAHGAELSYNNGYYWLSNSQFEVNQMVSGELLDIKMTYENTRPIVYVWLLEAADANLK